MNDMQRPRRIITILGMHRSGTSCLTGSLQASGLNLGRCYEANEHNKKGNRENPEIISLHQQMLKRVGASWKQPVAKLQWLQEDKDFAARILEEYQELDIWGFKDPRSLMAIEGWAELIPDLERVGIFRHPLSVARSLEKRNSFPVETGLKIWYQYNSLLFREWRKYQFPIISFDLTEDEFLEAIKKIVIHLDLDKAEGYSSFFTPDLRTHNESSVAKLPRKVLELYASLKEVAW